MPWVVKLYLLGLFLSLVTAFLGLVDFLGDLRPPQGLDPCLSGPWMEPERGSPVDGPRGGLVGDRRTSKAFGSFS